MIFCPIGFPYKCFARYVKFFLQEAQRDMDFEATAEGVRDSYCHKSPSCPTFSAVHHSDPNDLYDGLCNAASARSETLVGRSDLGTLPGCPTPLRTKCVLEDTSFSRSCGLKRGKPNTVKTGLPSPLNRRSLDVANETRLIFNNEALKVRRNSVAVVDTSPITGDRDAVLQHDSPRLLQEAKRHLTFQASSASLVLMETDCASPEGGHRASPKGGHSASSEGGHCASPEGVDCASPEGGHFVSPEGGHDRAFIDCANEVGNSPITDPCVYGMSMAKSDNELNVVNSQTSMFVVPAQSIPGDVSSSESVLSPSDRLPANRLFSNPVLLGIPGTVGFSEMVEKPSSQLKAIAVVDEGVAKSDDCSTWDTVSGETVILPSHQVALNKVSNAEVLSLRDCSTPGARVSDETLLQVSSRIVSDTSKGHDRLGNKSPRCSRFVDLVGEVSSGTLTPKRLPRLLDPIERFVCKPLPGKQDGSAASKSTGLRDPNPEGTMLSTSNRATTPVPKIKQSLITGSVGRKKTALGKTGSGTTDSAVQKKDQLLTRCGFPLKNLPRNNL